MAQKVQVLLIDDLDGHSPAEETVLFGLDGVHYEIDLSSDNAARLRTSLAEWIRVARRTGGRATRGRTPRGTAGGETAKIREWAKAQGFEVSERGRISADIKAKYAAAH